MPAPASWSVNRLAARAIALAPLPLTDRRELLDVAGLIGPDGDVAPDDRHTYDLDAWTPLDFDEDFR